MRFYNPVRNNVPVCLYADFPQYREICGKPAVTEGQQGWLCEQHGNALQFAAPAPQSHSDADLLMVEGIIRSESKLIQEGKVIRVRFGALDPSYIHYWEPKH